MNAKLQFRKATVADLSAMRAIYAPFVTDTTVTFEYTVPTEAEFAARFARITESYPWYVCECNGVLAGYAYADRAFERAAFGWDADLSVYIAPDYQHMGIGKTFYEMLEQELLRLGYHNVYALVTGENQGSCRFHESLGYALLGTLPQTGYKLGRWVDLYWYGKRLQPAAKPISK